MRDRIDRRPYRLGAGESSDPDYIEELRARQAKHERLTRGAPKRAFAMVLKDRMKQEKGEEDEEPKEDEEQPGAKNPLLGLDPNQDASLANKGEGRRSAMVIVKG